MQDPDTLRLDEFGKFLIEHLRDRAFQYYDALLKNPRVRPLLQSRLQEKLAPWNSEQQDVVRMCIGLAIDAALHDFLFTLQVSGDAPDNDPEEHTVQMLMDGRDVAKLSGDFGLHGELVAENGWVTKYSNYPNLNETV